MSSPKRDVRDLAVRFALKARSDEITLEKLADDHDVPDDVIGFHAQQAVEKLLKAALANAGVPPPRVHDLGRLVAYSTKRGSLRRRLHGMPDDSLLGRSNFDTRTSSMNVSIVRPRAKRWHRYAPGSTSCSTSPPPEH